MRQIITIIAILWAGAAQAHIGHLGELAGHGHWLGAAAAGAAIALGLWGLKGRKPKAEEMPEEELQDA